MFDLSAIFGIPIQTLLDVKSVWLSVTILLQLVVASPV